MMDEIDRRLLLELYKNGSESYTVIGKRLAVVEGTVRKRVKRLVDSEALKIVGVPNLHRLGYSFMAVMGMQVQMAKLRTVADQLAKEASICWLAFVTGRYDLVAVVLARSAEEFSQIMEKKISVIPGVLRTETFVALDMIKGGWATLEIAEILHQTVGCSNRAEIKRKPRSC